jgi:hypothetical protein
MLGSVGHSALCLPSPVDVFAMTLPAFFLRQLEITQLKQYFLLLSFNTHVHHRIHKVPS